MQKYMVLFGFANRFLPTLCNRPYNYKYYRYKKFYRVGGTYPIGTDIIIANDTKDVLEHWGYGAFLWGVYECDIIESDKFKIINRISDSEWQNYLIEFEDGYRVDAFGVSYTQVPWFVNYQTIDTEAIQYATQWARRYKELNHIGVVEHIWYSNHSVKNWQGAGYHFRKILYNRLYEKIINRLNKIPEIRALSYYEFNLFSRTVRDFMFVYAESFLEKAVSYVPDEIKLVRQLWDMGFLVFEIKDKWFIYNGKKKIELSV